MMDSFAMYSMKASSQLSIRTNGALRSDLSSEKELNSPQSVPSPEPSPMVYITKIKSGATGVCPKSLCRGSAEALQRFCRDYRVLECM